MNNSVAIESDTMFIHEKGASRHMQTAKLSQNALNAQFVRAFAVRTTSWPYRHKMNTAAPSALTIAGRILTYKVPFCVCLESKF